MDSRLRSAIKELCDIGQDIQSLYFLIFHLQINSGSKVLWVHYEDPKSDHTISTHDLHT